MANTIRLTVYVPREMAREVRMEAYRRGISASALVESALLKDRKLALRIAASKSEKANGRN